MAQLECIIEDTVFRNEENGYTVLEARAGRQEVMVVGVFPALTPGEQVCFEGDWVEHPQYGKQWKATGCQLRTPTSLLGIERFLGSGLIQGVGSVTARLIVQEFGLKTLEIMTETPERLSEVSGIGKKRAQQIAESFREQFAVRQAMVFLQSYGVSPALAVKISKRYGDRVQQLVQENPYRLVDDIEGVGFLTADRIALSMGISQDSEYRLQAGIKYALRDAAGNGGHTYLPKDQLLYHAARLLRVDEDMLPDSLVRLLFDREVVLSELNGEKCCMLPAFYYAEREVAKRLHMLMQSAQVVLPQAVERDISDFEKRNHIHFSPVQRNAVSEALKSGLMVITGGPGTGKTTIINCILSLMGKDVLLAAPTGRAAKRMSEATGQEAKTLHRLLEYTGDEEAFQRNEENPLECTCVIVDEMSMVDIFLMRSLLRALKPGTRLILVGDADQLPSVGAGNVLGDILKSGVIPSVRLTDIFRQDEKSLIVLNAHRINQGEMPVLNQKGSDFFFERKFHAEEAADTIVGLCANRLPKFLKSKSAVQDIQVLAPMKKGACGVLAINKLLQEALNPPKPYKKEMIFGETVFRVGDKVMHIKNNYSLEWRCESTGQEGLGVFNGDMGFVLDIDKEEKVVSVLYDDDRHVEYMYQQLEELELAYCLSVHKSQGSEFPCVVMPVVGGSNMLLNRNLFYTALTRARKLVVLVGREEAIAAMVRNDHIAMRYTALRERLCEMQS
ncbi:MAG: ATP-dependent RecD-like DNA helicase [Clostridia bacterium]|nr:ATP-dependent RecD-like DNA helicase [Clostridia bacterium]